MTGRLLVINPAFNEETKIGQVVKGALQHSANADVLVVNDGSRDKTGEVAARSGARVVSHPYNLGYGAALQTGYRYGVKGGYDVVVQMDGDGQHDPRGIPYLVGPLEENRADVVIGSRFIGVGGGEDGYRAPFGRRMGIALFRRIVAILTGQRITDPTSGYQAMKRNVFEWFAGDNFPIDYPDADVIIMLHRAGFRISEVPVKMYSYVGNKSMHSGLKPLYYIFKMFLSILVTVLRK